MRIKGVIIEYIETFLVSLLIIFILYIFIASVEVVWGPSMEPNFHTGERILVEKITKGFRTLQRGDVVVFIPPNDTSKHYIKRVIGLPGDVVEVFNCNIYISRDNNLFKLEESYLNPDTCTEGGDILQEGKARRIGDNEYMLLGDNRVESLDSRMLGFIDKKSILGRVVFRFWPLSKAGFIK